VRLKNVLDAFVMKLDPRSAKAGFNAGIRALEIEVATMRASHAKQIRELTAALEEARTVIAEIRAELLAWQIHDAQCEKDYAAAANSIH
jgi:hypothetical protein